MFALEGRAATVTAEDLRFSKSEIARFFDPRLSRQELAAVVDDLAGWPLALHICRNAGPHGAANAAGGGDDDTVAGWIEMRLWRGLPVVDPDFVLDIALFDRVDPGPDRRGDRGANRGTAARVDADACRAAVDHGRRRVADAAASIDQGLLRQAAVRGNAGVPDHPLRCRTGARAPRTGG